MKYSIIIPTYNKHLETIIPCLESLVLYTGLSEAEIIVVANGSDRELFDFLQKFPVRVAWMDKPIGYTAAINMGIKMAQGEYLVLLNNDTVLLEQPVNQWLDLLEAPFLIDEKMGATGPMMVNAEATGRPFIIFFCVMISRSILDKVGLLDEVFSPGYGEDTDFCHRLELYGYKIAQVPNFSDVYYGENQMTGEFPIFHKGNVTFKKWPGGEALLERNNNTLKARFCTLDIERAKGCDGYMSEIELTWLAEKAKSSLVFIEIGSWHGRSSRAIADNLPEGGRLYCVDHWLGSAVERDHGHASAAWKEGDHAFLEFCDNLSDHILSGKVIPIRLSGNNAAEFLGGLDIKGDVVFIDAGHTYEEVKEDIGKWLPLVKDGGILCGHDYYYEPDAWPGVKLAVDEIFGNKGEGMGYIYGNSIWSHVIDQKLTAPIGRQTARFDCFSFNNEFEILERRLTTMWDVVDRFVIVEANLTHSAKPKPYYFQENLERFKPYLSKITHIMVSDFSNPTPWGIERHQRDCITRGLNDCHPNDLVIITDVDEIPNPDVFERFAATGESIAALEMDLYYYDENCKAEQTWLESKIIRYKYLKQQSPTNIRYIPIPVHIIPNAGNHYSYFGGVERVIKKIEDAAHTEYNNPEFKDPSHIKECIQEGKDLFKRQINYQLNK